jgi:lysyl-tRNA synthetase class 2
MALASSNLKSFSYDPEWEELTIWFRSGGVYRYDNVPEDVVDEMKFAESRGRYFYRYIRNNPDYPFTILRHARKGYRHSFNVGKSSEAQRHRLKTFRTAPWNG